MTEWVSNSSSGKWTMNREELAAKYFKIIPKPYAKSNLGLISLLSDVQHAMEGDCDPYWQEVLNDIKCVLDVDLNVGGRGGGIRNPEI